MLNLDSKGLTKVAKFKVSEKQRLYFFEKVRDDSSDDIKDQVFKVVISQVQYAICVQFQKTSISMYRKNWFLTKSLF